MLFVPSERLLEHKETFALLPGYFKTTKPRNSLNTLHTIQMERHTDVFICVWAGRQINEVCEVCRN